MKASTARIRSFGNALTLRLTPAMVEALGAVDGSEVQVTSQPGRIVVRAKARPTLEQMLAKYDPTKHGGQFLDDAPIGREIFESHSKPAF